jgi:putative membrane protein
MLFRKEPEREQVIITLSAINTTNAFFVLVALFLILRPRSGAAIVVNQLIPVEQWSGVSMPTKLIFLIIGGLVAATLGFFLTLIIGKRFAKVFTKIPYRKIVTTIIIFIIVMVFMFTGVLGLFILAISTCIGLLPPFFGVRRSHAMGVLLVPVIIILW